MVRYPAMIEASLADEAAAIEDAKVEAKRIELLQGEQHRDGDDDATQVRLNHWLVMETEKSNAESSETGGGSVTTPSRDEPPLKRASIRNSSTTTISHDSKNENGSSYAHNDHSDDDADEDVVEVFDHRSFRVPPSSSAPPRSSSSSLSPSTNISYPNSGSARSLVGPLIAPSPRLTLKSHGHVVLDDDDEPLVMKSSHPSSSPTTSSSSSSRQLTRNASQQERLTVSLLDDDSLAYPPATNMSMKQRKRKSAISNDATLNVVDLTQ
jgi:hypothetical protein